VHDGASRTASRCDLDELLATRALDIAFQPLVDLDSGGVVGYEALARGPVGTALASPRGLFEAAYAAGRVPELDWLCRAMAYQAALRADLNPMLTLFVNAEPVSLAVPCPEDLRLLVEQARGRLRIVLEVTERAVAHDPASLLAAVGEARAAGWGVALDDVGADPASLAIMPFLRPDVIKLDLRLIQSHSTTEIARIVNAVLAEAERTGATILAEGLETSRHVQVAQSMGAALGQGYLFGRPGGLPTRTVQPCHPVQFLPEPAKASGPTPFSIISAVRPIRRTTKQLLEPTSRYLENHGLDPADPIVILACFQEERHFTPLMRERFARLAKTSAFVGAVGVGMPDVPAPGVRGGRLAPGDPMRGEWVIIAVGPHFAGALVARDCGDAEPDASRRFDAVVTHDRVLVLRAAEALLTRITGSPQVSISRIGAPVR
jgi:EAL domain-containing protein (putative c-di-GMP-specific phosphodiesterase class I)